MAGGRFKELLKKYGKVAIGVHCSVSAASITGLYIAIKNNVDIESLLHKWHLPAPSHTNQEEAATSAPPDFEEETKKKSSNVATSAGGALAVAILCNKALFPIRVPITIALTPPVSRFLARRRLIKTGL